MSRTVQRACSPRGAVRPRMVWRGGDSREWRGDDGPADHALLLLLETLVRWNVYVMERLEADGRPLPPLYAAGVVYRPEHPDPSPHAGHGPDDWRDALETYRCGEGDCDDLAGWRAAELRRAGIAATCAISSQQVDGRVAAVTGLPLGSRLVHVVVRWPDGRIEDPSKVLGMEVA